MLTEMILVFLYLRHKLAIEMRRDPNRREEVLAMLTATGLTVTATHGRSFEVMGTKQQINAVFGTDGMPARVDQEMGDFIMPTTLLNVFAWARPFKATRTVAA